MPARILAVLLIGIPAVCQTTIYFDDSAPDRLRLGNSVYELTLGKTQGGILSISDKAANATLVSQASAGCIWAADNMPGCSFGTYRWNASSATLSLTYTAGRANATASLTLTNQPYLDLRLALDNQGDATSGLVTLPAGLPLASAEVQAGYLPFALPGVRLKPEFFRQHRSSISVYPSRNAAMDYLAVDVAGGHLALYTVNPSGPLQPAMLGFQKGEIAHSFPAWIPAGGKWSSPIVRLRIGQTARESILAYRADNAIAAYPAIADKLGARFRQVAESPLVKAHIEKPFAEYSRLLEQLDAPAILHPVAFQSPGFDRGYPDFLPPDPRWGTTADFRAFVEAAHARGFLIMPYTNPTWWCDDAPTLKNLAAADIAVHDPKGKPMFEKYPNGGGYVASPYAPLVRERLARLMAQWRNEVPVDFVFEDQVGARRWLPDTNPASPTPLSYEDGWLEHAATYAGRGLMTEDGWDRLAKSEIGFCGSALTGARTFNARVARWSPESRGNKSLGVGTWEPYPLATWAFHDKVVFYQHDLEVHLTARNLEVVTWNLAFGVSFSYIFPGLAAGTPPDRIELTNILQRTLGPRYVGRILTDFADLAPDVTRSTFEGGLTVIANWQPAAAYAVQGHQIVPGGYLAETSDKSVLAGVFQDTFNGRPLSGGAHYLIVERTPRAVVVRQPVGADTTLAIEAAGQVYAVDRSGNRLGEVRTSTDGKRVVFEYRGQLDGKPVNHYECSVKTI